MGLALRTKIKDVYCYADIIYQNFPLRNFDKTISLRPLRLCG